MDKYKNAVNRQCVCAETEHVLAMVPNSPYRILAKMRMRKVKLPTVYTHCRKSSIYFVMFSQLVTVNDEQLLHRRLVVLTHVSATV